MITKNRIMLLSGVLGFAVPAWFAWTIYVNNVPQNVATWGMILVLDGLGLVLAFKGGNDKPFLQIGWTLAAMFIFTAILLNGQPLVWGWTETISVVLCAVAIALWITKGALAAQWAYMAAMYLSLVPLASDYWTSPQPDTLWLWLWTIIGCLLAILGAEKRNFATTFVPIGAIGVNAIIAVLCII